MAKYNVLEFLDLQAVIDNGEEDELSDDELDKFFQQDNEIPKSESEWNARLSSPVFGDFEQEGSYMRDLVTSRGTHTMPRSFCVDSGVPQHFLMPRDSDLPLWAIRVKAGSEFSLMLQIGRWTIFGEEAHRPRLVSTFARLGIPGYIFLEGDLIPLEQRVALLLPHVPSPCQIEEGQWVQCLFGLYRDDIGFVCGHNPHSDLDLLIAFVPRIPEPSAQSTKRKKLARPDARTWTLPEVEAVWGPSWIQRKSGDEFLFAEEMYCAGLIMKNLTTHSVVTVAHAPINLLPFIRASCVRNNPSFTPWAHRFAQDNIRPQQRVRVKSGEQKGIIGRPRIITYGVATIVPENEGDIPPFDVSLRALSLQYVLGDNVKDRWSDSHGMVVKIDEDRNILVYIDKDSLYEITRAMDGVELFEPACLYYRFKEGDWVRFSLLMGPTHWGVIKDIEGERAVIIDKHTFDEFTIDKCDLEFCKVQGPSLPKNDPVHPLVNQSVIVSRGPSKGLYGRVKDIGLQILTVELEAKVVSSKDSRQRFKWGDIRIVPKDVENARTASTIRTHTPSPPPDIPPQDLTPEPLAGLSSGDTHWIFSASILQLIQWKIIPFYIKHTLHSGDDALRAYEGCVARMVPIDLRCTVPREGEITVNVIKRNRRKQMSINPIYLVPWEPIVGGEVVAFSGSLVGVISVAKAKHDKYWVVTFPADGSPPKLAQVHTPSPSSPALNMFSSDDPPSPTVQGSNSDVEGGPVVLCGQYLMRCVNPFLSVNVLIAIAQQETSEGSPEPSQFMTAERRSRYTEYWAAAQAFSPSLQTLMRQGPAGISDLTKGLIQGTRTSRSNDVFCLKMSTGRLASKTSVKILLSMDAKSDRGFNHNELGHMLIPTEHAEEFTNDPAGAKINEGVDDYQVTGRDMPAFLYEDPGKYDPEDMLCGFMRGYFLAHCLRAIFKGPKASMNRPTTHDRPTCGSVAHLCRLEEVTVPMMVYVAIQARFTLSSQQTWSRKDGTFSYEDFTEVLLSVFEHDEEWTKSTIHWWNRELFGDEHGLKTISSSRKNTKNNSFMARLKAQTKRRNDQASGKSIVICMWDDESLPNLTHTNYVAY
ncbi:hypothetical protein EI94DRAFT_1805484 [Lactarius quietus]|nr:hypothetical protein EI94DRAFT_1805484 [Lactarius quietus]